MDSHLELFASLAAPFNHDEVRLRPQGSRQIQYITARTVMNRLDDVLGPSNWWDDYVPQENSVICKLTIRLPDGTTLTKCDAGGYAGMSDSGDDDKSGFSDAFKRAAVKFGIGRYLYRDGVPRFVEAHVRPAERPAVTQSAGTPDRDQATSKNPPNDGRGNGEGPNVPHSGKALFAWIKHHDETNGTELFKYVSDWAGKHEFPARMVQWNEEQVERAYAESQRLLQSSQASVPSRSPSNGSAPKEPVTAGDQSVQTRSRRGR